MAKPQNRAVLQHQSRDLMAIFWGLAAWCTISLACTVFLIFSGTATAQSHSQSNLIASVADLTPNQGVIDQRPKGRETGLPLPRYVSFRNAKTNMRVGPGIQFELRAVYNRQWMPMQVVAESGHWREVQDWEGTRGWVHKDLLSSRRTARVSEHLVDLSRQPLADAPLVARLSRGVIAGLKSCQGNWCFLEVDEVKGWTPRQQLYGTFTHEDFGTTTSKNPLRFIGFP